MHMQHPLTLRPSRPGLHHVTSQVADVVRRTDLELGICLLFVPHTSASLLLQENADPSARRDLEDYFARLAPEDDPRYTHTAEGSDDMPAHLRAALTQPSLQIPFNRGRLLLGTWQGIYLWEHRDRAHTREVVVHVTGN